jgi:hypothetical protein
MEVKQKQASHVADKITYDKAGTGLIYDNTEKYLDDSRVYVFPQRCLIIYLYAVYNYQWSYVWSLLVLHIHDHTCPLISQL